MREMFRTAFSAITSIFRTVDKFARTVEQVSDYTLGEATFYNDQADIERSVRIDQMNKQLALAAEATE